ncbi:MAG: SgcJ/EcaC family oxidoreductase [Vicinamibacterales bacterium]
MSVLVLALVAPARVQSGQAGDEAAIRRVLQQHDETRNRGDWKAYGALFTTDADQLTSAGTWRRGSADIEKSTAEITSTTYKGGKYSTTVDRVRMIAPVVALADGAFEITNISGGGSRKGLTTLVLVNAGGQWRIAATRSMVPTPAGALPGK